MAEVVPVDQCVVVVVRKNFTKVVLISNYINRFHEKNEILFFFLGGGGGNDHRNNESNNSMSRFNKNNSPPREQMKRMPPSNDHRRNRDDRSNTRDRDRDRSGGGGGIGGGGIQDRDRGSRDKDRGSGSGGSSRLASPPPPPSLGNRKRSRSPRRTRSRSRSRSPPRRRPRTAPRYNVSVPKVALNFPESSVYELKKRYNNMYVPSDFFMADHSWMTSFPVHDGFKIQYASTFHIFNKELVESPLLSDAVSFFNIERPGQKTREVNFHEILLLKMFFIFFCEIDLGTYY